MSKSNMVVGVKQTMRLAEQGKLEQLYVADDADTYVTRPVEEVAESMGIPLTHVESRKKLGHLCGIDIGAATAGVIKA